MAILIANIGNSDLVVSIEGLGCFLPVYFDRREPNFSNAAIHDLSPEDKEIWDHRNEYVSEFLCDELEMEITKSPQGDLLFSFREFTEKLLCQYEKSPDYWHDRIRPGRIWGVVQEASSRFSINQVLFLATDQDPPNNDKDTFLLSKILKRWFAKSFPNLSEYCFQEQVIPRGISAVDQDGLMQYFYHFLSTLDPTELILVSIKGGTPQMRNALQNQAISSGLSRLIFIDPQLHIPDVLRGNSSRCKLSSYWRYTHTQKVLTIRMLLDRWDFDGAAQVCSQWEKNLKELSSFGINDASDFAIDLEASTQALELGVAFLNLDYQRAKDLVKASQQRFGSLAHLPNNYSPLLNLYTQCRICIDLGEISNFLIKTASFYETLLHYLISKLDGNKYFDKEHHPDDFYLIPRKLSKSLEDCFFSGRDPERSKKLSSRFDKRKFLTCLINHERPQQDKDIYEKILVKLKSLDYWVDLRNRIIHTGKGFSQETMLSSLERDRRTKEDFSEEACSPIEILDCLSRTYNLMTDLLRLPRSRYVGDDNPYYLYSDIKTWIADKWNMSIHK